MSDPVLFAAIRDFEIEQVLRRLPPRARVLELGGGSGRQARRLTEAGCAVLSVDLRESAGRSHRCFPVAVYDGRRVPARDASVDVVFSSNVLEHVVDLPALLDETRRVLRDDGFAVHLMPTATWRLWTTVAHYLLAVRRMWRELWQLGGVDAGGLRRDATFTVNRLAAIARHERRVPAHGEGGSAWSELASFRRAAWRRAFERNGFEVLEVCGLGLFHSGSLLLGARLPWSARRALSALLGSSCALYRVRPVR